MAKTSKPDPLGENGHSKDKSEFLIVGIGASAGGIKALKDFFANVPADSGIAYVVILHLSPEHKSHLAEVLQHTANIPVKQVVQRERVLPDNVYVIPPNKSLAMEDGHLTISDVKQIEERRAPIDVFFRTLAQTHNSRAVGVILSGTGSDGSMGMKRLKEMGGIVIVQDPQEAEYDGMPRNSLATGLVDTILPAAGIPAKLLAYRRNLDLFRIPIETEEYSETDEKALLSIFTELRIRTGHDFSNYKRATVLRRIERRIHVHELNSLQAYSSLMREKPEEARMLLKDLLISVTNFFRDKEAFAELETSILPKLFYDKHYGDTIRVWVAGCATGEEAYSLAMMFAERAWDAIGAPKIQIFASDIDEAAIAHAREGIYTEADVADVSPTRLKRFFERTAHGYRVKRELREMILFAVHNAIKDAPFGHLDLITCRNLMIYLNRTGQKRALEVFHFALNPGGYLFLGSSESAEDSSHLFAQINKESNVFQSRTVSSPVPIPITDIYTPKIPAAARFDERARENRALKKIGSADLHLQLLEKYAPPSVVVNENYDIVHMSANAGRFMQLMGGEPTNDLLRIIHPEIRIELRTALFQAGQQQSSVEARKIPIGNGKQFINLIVRPVLESADPARGYFLVLFEEIAAEKSDSQTTEIIRSADPVNERLEEELIRTKSQLHSTIEQYEVQTEELRATNEELQAANEELRSQAEELETGKEELQSINEELTTVNEELKNKIDELSHAHSDFHNLMSATDIGTIFLDRDLRVKFFTPPTRNVINIIHSDTNRKLSDLTHKFKDRNLISDIEIVLETLQVVEREIETSDGKWYLIRILPYRAADDRINGVALTFIDTTRRKMAEDALRESYERMNEILESINDAFYAVDCDFNFTYINRKAEEIWGRERETLIGKQYWKEFPEVVGSESYKMHHKALAEQRAIHYETVSPVLKRWIDVSIYPDSRGGLSCYFRDVTERKEAEDALRQNEERMRLLVESVMDYAIFSTNPDGFIENWNPGAERMFGYTEKEAIGQNCAMIFTPEDQAANVPDAERKVAREEGRAADERWHMRKDKTRFYVSGVQTPLFDKDGNLTGFVKVARDMTEKIEADDKLARAHNELENKVQERTRELKEANKALRAEVKERKQAEEQRIQLLHQIVTMQEDERRRIARDLHDQLGQQLTGLRLMLENIRKECAELQICEQVAAAQAIAAQLDTDVDFLAWELRPAALDDLGLKAAVANYVSEWSRHFNIPAEFHSSNIDRERLSPEAETNIYRICQEALNNIWKHAQATHVSVLLERRDGHIVLIVEDDGVGFNPKRKRKPDENDRGIGLIGMQERAALIGGALEIESAPKEGTTVFARVPLRKRKKKTIESHSGNGNS